MCNHPELFERADVVAPFSFSRFGQSGPLIREGDLVSLSYSTRNPIELSIPRLLYEEGGLLDVPSEHSRATSRSGCLPSLFNIWSTDWLQHSLYEEGKTFRYVYNFRQLDVAAESSTFAFLRLLDMSPSNAHALHAAPLICRRLLATQEEARTTKDAHYHS